MIVQHGQVYLHDDHVEALRDEEEYVRKRYQAVARTMAPKPFGIHREAVAGMIGRSLRQIYRVLRRFKEECLSGLRLRSRRPKPSPNRTPGDIEAMVVAVREASGFGPNHVSALVNVSPPDGDHPPAEVGFHAIISPYALVYQASRLGKHVYVGHHSVVHPLAVVGDGVHIGCHCVIGVGAVVGAGAGDGH